MRSTLQALTWELLTYGRWVMLLFLAISMLPLLVYASITSLSVQAGDPVMLLLEVSIFPTLIFLLTVGVGAALGPMGRLYSKPLTNLTIAAWHMGAGMFLLGLQTALVIWCYNYFYSAGWPLAGGVLFVMTLWVAAQPMFCMGTRSFSMFCLTCLPLVVVMIWFITRYQSEVHKPHDWMELTTFEVVTLVVLGSVFAVATVRSVALDRCGDSARPTRLWQSFVRWYQAVLGAWMARSAGPPRPFASAMQAQFWSEWRVKGWALPLVASMIMTFVLTASVVDRWSKLEPNWSTFHEILMTIYEALPGTGGLLVIVAALIGGALGVNLDSLAQLGSPTGQSSVRSGQSDVMGSFLATRPLSDRQIAHCYLKVCSLSLGIICLIWLLVFAMLMLVSWLSGLGPIKVAGSLSMWYLMPCLVLVAWSLMSNLMSITLSGYTKWIVSAAMALMLVYAVVLGMIRWYLGRPAVDTFALIALVGVSCAVSGSVIFAYFLALRRRLVQPAEAGWAALLVVVLGAASVTLLPKPISLDHASLVAIGAGLTVSAWAWAPLAVRRNRHRV